MAKQEYINCADDQIAEDYSDRLREATEKEMLEGKNTIFSFLADILSGPIAEICGYDEIVSLIVSCKNNKLLLDRIMSGSHPAGHRLTSAGPHCIRRNRWQLHEENF